MARGIVIEGKRVGALRASFLLTKEAFRFLRADTELFLVPVVATVTLVGLFAILILVILGTGMVTVTNGSNSYTIQGIIIFFASYFLSSYVMALSRATVTYTVAKRAQDGNATLGESMGAAVRRTPALFVWSLTDASVGVLIRLIAERSGLIATLIARLCGASWRVATYFVVPAMILDRKGSFSAIARSTSVFRQLWGETVVTNVSLTLAFFLAHVVMFLSFVGAVALGVEFNQVVIALVAAVLWIIWFAVALVLHSVLSSILTTLLYLYATATVPPHNFNQELLGQILVRANETPIVPIAPVATTT